MKKPLWTPDSSRVEKSNITTFIRSVNKTHKLNLSNYSMLYDWSISERESFWSAMWDFGGVVASAKGNEVLRDGDKMPGARWFPESQLNYAENLLKFRDNRTALVFLGENGRREVLSYRELYLSVAQLSSALKKVGVQKGDRIAGYMPNCIETVIAMLASASLGAVWSSCSPDFGINGVIDRFGQIKPKVLFTTDGYYYSGKTLNSLQRVETIQKQLPDIEVVVVVPFISVKPDVKRIEKAVLYENFVDHGAKEISFEQLSFDHPLYVMYSSGTTGVPKCIVHSVGGTLIQQLKEHILHTDLERDDVLFYFTTCGWMMWNWLVGGLAVGCTLVLFDGSPFYPNANILWDIAEQEKISVFGTSAKYIAALEKAGCKPRDSHQLGSLKAVLSTGSPLSDESYAYVYTDIAEELCLSSISGGTDILSCFALGCPTRPVYAGELQCRGLGMAVDVFDDDGNSIEGQKGELVCTAPFPSMPIGFWNDDGDIKYRSAYFADYDNVWAQGDYAEITERDGLIIHGRSDAVLNPGGVRIGTAEIYRQVEKVDGVMESLCVGQQWQGDVRVVLFVRMRNGVRLDDEIDKTIKQTIRSNTTPRHVPAKIIAVADIPRTLSGKIVELAVSNVIHNRPVKNTDALANPDALNYFKDLPQLLS